MNFFSVVACFLLLALTSQGVESKFDFMDVTRLSKEWSQSSSEYFQPLGKVESTADGVKLNSNDKTDVFVVRKERFPVHEGDRIKLTLEFKCEKNTYVYLGVYEFQNRTWVKNDLVAFSVKPGMESVSMVVTVKSGSKSVNQASVAFGIGGGRQELLVRSIRYEVLGMDPLQVRKPELPTGLALHFDASRRTAMEFKDGKITVLKDLSGNGNDLKALSASSAPIFLERGLNQLPMMRFDGKQEMKTVRTLDFPKGLTVFLIFRRESAQGNGEGWQDALYWGDGKNPDNTGRYHMTVGASSAEKIAQLYLNKNPESLNQFLLVGSNAGKRGFLKGDIGEILVFSRTAFSSDEVEKIRNYLFNKWNVSEDDYVRFGSLPEAPKRLNDSFPLSDQENKGKWRKLEEYCDEFNGSELNRKKWTDLCFYSIGPAPVRILPDNLKIKDGMARITTVYDPNMPSGRVVPRGQEYHSFSTGMMQSIFMFRYGYIEIRAKIQATTFNSAFWMIGRGTELKTGRDVVPEIDVFELAGKSFAHTYSYNMALHLVQHKPERKHYDYAKNWKSDFNFTDDFHVYGLEWTPNVIRYYIDGVLIREFKVKENHWVLPMTVHFDSLPHFDWFGLPDPADFPTVYAIDYFRLWKNPETDLPDDWNRNFKITHTIKTQGFSYDYYKKNGNKIVPTAPGKSSVPIETIPLNAVGRVSQSEWRSFFGASVKWDAFAFKGKGALLFSFPAVISRKDSGEVQYAAPSALWPRLELPASALAEKEWSDNQYLAIDFINPNRGIEVFILKVTTESNQTAQRGILLKSGEGTMYWKIPEQLRKSPIKSVTMSVRGSQRDVKFYLTDLRLEK